MRSLKIIFGVALVCTAYAFITVPLKIVNGGVTSLSFIIAEVTGIEMSFFVNGITLAILALCGLFLGRRFFTGSLLSCLAYLGIFTGLRALSVHTGFFLDLPYWLAVPIAAVIVGVGYGICLRQEATILGFDTIALILNKYLPRLKVPWTMAVINTAVVASGFFVFGWPQVLAGVCFSWIQAKVLALVYQGGKETSDEEMA